MTDHSTGLLAAAMRRELEGIPRSDPRPGTDLAQVQDDLKLMGLAFSGGGIRSATFNLGILQGLEKLGLLPLVDYLSTVSGGGYIGSWYLACLREGLKDEKERGPALLHLRKFSRYLAPQAGFFSADAWTIAMVWLRNTVLLQTMLVSLFAVVLLSPRFFELWFLTFPETYTTLAAAVLFAWTVIQAVYRLGRMSDADATTAAAKSMDPQGTIQVLIVLPLLVAGSCLSSALWRSDPDKPLWCYLAGGMIGLATCLTARSSLLRRVRNRPQWLAGVVGVGVLCGALFGSLTYGLLWVYQAWGPEFRPDGQWLSGMVGAPVILIALSLTVVLQVGLLGRAIDDAMREWWSRLGAFLAIYSMAALAVGAAAVYGPFAVSLLFSKGHLLWNWLGGSLAAGGLASTLGGLAAASNSETGGTANGKSSSPAKELLAKTAPFIFIAGLLIAVAAGAHYLIAGQITTPDTHWMALDQTLDTGQSRLWWATGISIAALLLLAWRIDIDETSMNLFYRNRLVRCYLGAARAARKKRHPNLFTGFDFADDFALASLRPQHGYTGPVPILNTALNLTGGDNAALEQRRAASFFFTPYESGSDPTGVEKTEDVGKFRQGVKLGSCVATSGAAASPNMGYHTSAPVAFLMTFFNVRLGLWLRSPRVAAKGNKQTPRWGLWYLLKELFATADVKDNYLYLSDGGHFENLGVYELVRRRCRYIIVGDAEQDGNLVMDALGGLVRKCRIDFDVEIEIDTSQIRHMDEHGRSRAHCAVGRILYKNPSQEGYLIYLKSSLTGDEDSDILQYKAETPAFPHESTGDQFFDESQFESYRGLGEHIVTQVFGGGPPIEADRSRLENLMRITRDTWDPPSPFTERRFAHHAEQVSHLWHEIRKAGLDQVLDQELFPGWRKDLGGAGYENIRQGLYLCQTILQLMQNVYLDLHLDTEWDHPDNKGWKALFLRWAESPTLREAYELSGSTFGDRFRQFCDQRLKLTRGGN
jgi:hypothetical protein